MMKVIGQLLDFARLETGAPMVRAGPFSPLDQTLLREALAGWVGVVA